jgi:TPR repeat protein
VETEIMSRTIKRALTVVVAAVGLAGGAIAGPLDDGAAAVKSGDYAAALAVYRPLAEQGNPVAQYSLGQMYFNGQGVTRNDAEALKWYSLAARQGNGSAQASLATMYDVGEGVPQNYIRAYMWSTLATSKLSSSSPGVSQFIVNYRNLVLAHKMTPLQIVQAKELAQECEASNYMRCE